jgi:hypothetical protein
MPRTHAFCTLSEWLLRVSFFDVAAEVKILFEQVSNASISLDNVILEVVPMVCNR